MPADTWLALHHIDLLTCICQAQGSLDPGNTATQHQCGLLHIHRAHVERSVMVHPADRCADHVFGFFGCQGRVVYHPGAVLTNVGHLEEEWTQPTFFTSPAKGRLMHQWCAGSHHYPVQTLLADILRG